MSSLDYLKIDSKISVVIPLYNHEKFIEEAIESALKQSKPVFEIIVVDDGSIDSSAKIVKKICEKERKVKYYYQENKGAHVAINEGIKKSRGDYVSILNSDDAYDERRFEKIMNYFENEGDADVVFTGINFIDARGNGKKNKWYRKARNFFEDNGDMVVSIINGNFFMTTSNLFARKRIFEEIGLFNNLRYAHDLDFFLRLFVRNKNVGFLREPLVNYRMHGKNTIKEGTLKVKFEWAAVIANYIAEYSRMHSLADESELIRRDEIFSILEKHRLTRYVNIFLQFYFFLKSEENFFDELWKNQELVDYVRRIVY